MSEGRDGGPRLLCIGAHPDDCEMKASGLAALWVEHGGSARFLTMTDGGAGHQELGGARLAQVRRAEARAGANAVGADSLVLDIPDGMLMPTLENRLAVIGAIREFGPDVIACHRVNDYHPDHRYSAVLVQDACYLVMVPNILAGTPVPSHAPVVLFMCDRFTKPNPIEPHLVFDIDRVIERKLDAIECHRSQVFEWLPWVGRYLDQVPKDPEEARAYIRERAARSSETEAERFRNALTAKYGSSRGRAVRYAEVYEVSEYGAPLTEEGSRSLFPF
jgi:N-acetylglucosamine malate deacetylase 1